VGGENIVFRADAFGDDNAADFYDAHSGSRNTAASMGGEGPPLAIAVVDEADQLGLLELAAGEFGLLSTRVSSRQAALPSDVSGGLVGMEITPDTAGGREEEDGESGISSIGEDDDREDDEKVSRVKLVIG
jgi:hypothetical protein